MQSNNNEHELSAELVEITNLNGMPKVLEKLPVRITVNPLRAGEPFRMSCITPAVVGAQPEKRNPNYAPYIIHREFQNIAVCAEDIEHLYALLEMAINASDYTLRLIGKYIIIELHSIESCLKNLKTASPALKTLVNEYEGKLNKLDEKHQFTKIRNKIAAHRHDDGNNSINLEMLKQVDLWRHITNDAIREYVDCLGEFQDKLQNLHPHEYGRYIKQNGRPIAGVTALAPQKDYVPFFKVLNLSELFGQPSPPDELNAGDENVPQKENEQGKAGIDNGHK